MHFKRMFINTQNIQPGEPPHTRKRHISLPKLKDLREIHHRRIHAHPLALMHSDSPSKAKWNLGNLCSDFTVFFHCPIHWCNGYGSATSGFNNWMSAKFFKVNNSAQRAVHKSFFLVIFSAHNCSAELEL